MNIGFTTSSNKSTDKARISSTSLHSTSAVLVRRSRAETEARLRWGEHNINSGCLRELPMIAIDRFHGEVLKAKIFFLTHLHTDHMVGLEFPPFLKRLEQPGVKFYTSSATPLLFPVFDGSGYFGGLEKVQELIRQEKIVPVDVNHRIELDYTTEQGQGSKKVYVTMIPAGHCPGSVMLLFEYDSERILYTGDYRLSSSEIKNLRSCYYESEEEYLKDYPSCKPVGPNFKPKLKKITHLYLDTTFCSNKKSHDGATGSSSSSSLVSRDNAIQDVLPRIKNHLKHMGHIIQLEFSARVSHEYAIVQLHKLLNQKTHVSRELHNIYSEIDSCINSMTLDSNAVIHLCKKNENCLHGKNVLRIKFSAMWYTMGNGTSTVRQRGQNFVNVCYSMHASMKEMGTLISAFDAQLVTPLVLPRNLPRDQIEGILRSVTDHNFEYKDYENEPIMLETEYEEETICKEMSYRKRTDVDDVKSHAHAPTLPSLKADDTDTPPCLDCLEPKRAKFVSWSRAHSPTPLKL